VELAIPPESGEHGVTGDSEGTEFEPGEGLKPPPEAASAKAGAEATATVTAKAHAPAFSSLRKNRKPVSSVGLRG
jgi:hypothetical protein